MGTAGFGVRRVARRVVVRARATFSAALFARLRFVGGIKGRRIVGLGSERGGGCEVPHKWRKGSASGLSHKVWTMNAAPSLAAHDED